MTATGTRPTLTLLLVLAASLSMGAAEEDGPSKLSHVVKPGQAVDKKVRYQGITFHVRCPNEGSLNTLTLVPTGLSGKNDPITREIEGTVSKIEVDDLDGDGAPEIYISVVSAGSGAYGSLVAYASNRNRSLSEITLPDLAEDKKASEGYMGHDEFAVVETSLVRRFPVYKEGDSNAGPTGGMRQLQYKLKAGEAGWKLAVDRVVEY